MTALRLMQPSGSVNPTQEAFQRRTDQLNIEQDKQNAAREKDQQQKDAEMLKVFQFAGDGYVNEAKYYAQQKGLQVPDNIFNDALLSKGLAMSGELYPDNPEAAQKYAMAFRSVDGDLLSRNQAGLAAAGKPLSKTDRELALYERKLQLADRYKSSDNSMTPYQSAMIDLRRQELAQNNKPDPFANVKIVDGVAYQVDETGKWNPVTPQKPNNDRLNYISKYINANQSGFDPRPIDQLESEGMASFNRLTGDMQQPVPAPAQNQQPVAVNQETQVNNPYGEASPIYFNNTGGIITPPVQNAMRAPDGKWYVQDPNSPSGYSMVVE